MSSARTNPFATFAEPPEFQPKPKQERKTPNEAIEKMAEENGFPSRQAPKQPRAPKRKPNYYRTGRDRQLNLKATDQTVERLHKLTAERKIPMGALLELALDALEANQRKESVRKEEQTQDIAPVISG